MCVSYASSPLFVLFGDQIWSIRIANKIPPSLALARLEQELRHWLLIRSCCNVNYNSKVPSL
jgi:hypothetical protein